MALACTSLLLPLDTRWGLGALWMILWCPRPLLLLLSRSLWGFGGVLRGSRCLLCCAGSACVQLCKRPCCCLKLGAV